MKCRRNHAFGGCLIVLVVSVPSVSAQECTPGTAPDGSGGCEDCAAGTFSDATNEVGCAPCPVGTFAAEGATGCDLCAVGLYDHDSNATTSCQYCPIGRFTLEEGAQDCHSCLHESRWIRVHGDMSERPRACEACPPGFFEPETEADYCESCPAGSYSPPVVMPMPKEHCPKEDLVVEWEDGVHETDHAEFGPRFVYAPAFADLEIVIADDRGCISTSTIANDYAFQGKVVLVPRGTCTFETKVRVAQSLGAVAVIIHSEYGSDEEGLLGRAFGVGTQWDEAIPSLYLDAESSDALATAIGEGTTTVSFHCEHEVDPHPGCDSCDAGQYDHDNNPMTKCLPCPADTFSNETGVLICEPCPPGLFSNLGSLSLDDCRAPDSTYIGCYNDGPDEWDSVVVSDTMGDIDLVVQSRDKCSMICSEYRYMFLTWTARCRCGNEYGSNGLAVLNHDGTTQCGENGMECGTGKRGVCAFVSSVYGVRRMATCTHVGDLCSPGTTLRSDASSVLVDELNSTDLQLACCETSCATWGTTNECNSGVFIASGASRVSIGTDPQSACCTSTCEPGNIADEDGRCHTCPAGRAPSLPGTRCEPCGAGSYVAPGSAYCDACPPGQFDDDSSSITACVDCPEGQYTIAPGQCDGSCPAGKYSTKGSASANDCEQCGAGTYDHDGIPNTICLTCPVRYFAPDPVSCLGCSPGTFSDIPTSTCSSCPSGRFSEPMSSSERDCECPMGTFAGKEYTGRIRDAVGLMLRNECVPCEVGMEHASQVEKCPKEEMMLEWHGTSRYTPGDDYPSGFYPTGHYNRVGLPAFDPYEIHNVEIVAADPINGCTPLRNAAEVAGKVVLVRRGACLYDHKVINAEQAGAWAFLMDDSRFTLPEAGQTLNPGSDPPFGTPMIALTIHRNLGYELREAIIDSKACTGTANELPGSCSDGSSLSRETCEAADCSGSACEWTDPETPTCEMIVTPGVWAEDASDVPILPTEHCPAGCTVTFPDGPITVSLNCGEACPYGNHCDGVCFPCSAGRTDDDNDPATACVSCPEMTYQDASGESECKSCPFGQVSATGASACTTEPLYLGCFEDRLSFEHARDLTGREFRLVRQRDPSTDELVQTPVEECAILCTGHTYMGLQGAMLCFCDNEYGTYNQLDDDQCGNYGSLCANGDDITCVLQNAVYRLPQWNCADVACDPGTALLQNQTSLSILGLSRDEQQTVCCASSCATWNETGNTCHTPGFCSDDSSVTQETCEAADCGGYPCHWTASQTGTRFMTRLSESIVAGSDPRTACCTDPCSPGQVENGGRCEACPAGKVSTEVDATACSDCPAGRYAPESTSVCRSCVDGQYDHDHSPATPCQQCDPGRFSQSGATDCEGACPVGTAGIAAASSAEDCIACAPGQHDHDRNPATPCLLCPPGQFTISAQQVDCENCDAGQSSVGGSVSCAAPNESYAATMCHSEWAACSESDGCIEEMHRALTAITVPVRGSEVLLSLLQCVTESTLADVSPSRGCLDPSGTNYDIAVATDDGSCVYECNVLSWNSDTLGNSICHIFSIDTSEWITSGAGVEWSSIGSSDQTDNVVIQGVKMYDYPPEGSTDWSHLEGTHPSDLTGEALDAWLAQPPQAGCNYEWFSEKLDWHAAQDECVSRGGGLASIHSLEDFEAAKQAIISGNGGQNTRSMEGTWIGANDERNEMGCSGGHGPSNATTRVGNLPELTGENFEGASMFNQIPELYGGAGVLGPVTNVQTDVWEWTDGSPWDFTAWVSEPFWPLTAPTDYPQGCDPDYGPIEYSELRWWSRCGVQGADHVAMNWFNDGRWNTENVEEHTCRTKPRHYMCGYPCGVRWTDPLVTTVTLPSFTERFDLVNRHLTLRHAQISEFQANGGGGINHGGVIDAISRSDVIIEYAAFSNNVQVGLGAGIAFAKSSSLAIHFSEIRGSRNVGNGAGVIYAHNSNVTISYTTVADSVSESSFSSSLSASVMLLKSCNAAVIATLFERNLGVNTIIAVTSAIQISKTAFVENVSPEPASGTHQSGAATQQTARGGATVSLLQGSEAVLTETRFTQNVGLYAGGLFIEHIGTTVVLHQVAFFSNTAYSSDYGSGAIAAINMATVTGHGCSFNGNSATSQRAAGACYSTDASVSLSNVSFSGNSANAHPTAGLQAASGAILSDTSSLELTQAILVDNHIESGAAIAANGGKALYVVNPKTVKLVECRYHPAVDVATEVLTVQITPGAVQGVLQGGCIQHPCNPGNRCAHANYSLSCSPCPDDTYSSDGIVCQSCPAGFGSTQDKTSCQACAVNTFSAAGVCLECPAGQIVTDKGTRCEVCPIRQTAVAGQSQNDQNTCGCSSEFYNVTNDLSVCFDRGFDEKSVELAFRNRQSMLSMGQPCQKCPTDLLDNPCMKCTAGAAAQIQPGYTSPQLPAESGRRYLSAAEFSSAQLIFRCHSDMDIGALRCPTDRESPGQCGDGYTGYLCSRCAPGYGMVQSQRCEPCEQQSANPTILLISIAILTLGALVLAITGGRHLDTTKLVLRCAFQPTRIVITYAQVASQLGDVLNFTPPPAFASVVEVMQPIMDIWTILFKSIGSSECFGLDGFASYWMLRVVILPVLFGLIVVVVYCIDRQRAPDKAYGNAKGNIFFSVFFVYPSVCATSFAAFICRKLSATHSVLEADDTILCDDPEHSTTKLLSGIVVVLFAFGLPVLFGYVLVHEARKYSREFAGMNSALAHRVAEDLDVDEDAASFVIRDVILGEDYGFLMDAFSPQYLYWEVLDMLRKLFLVGLILLIGRGSVAQLNTALLLSFGFFALQCTCKPYKISQDNAFRASTELHVFIFIVVALSLGKLDLRQELLSAEFYDWALLISFICLVPIAFIVTVLLKVRFVRHSVVAEKGPRRTFDRLSIGLKSNEDVKDFNDYLDQLRTQVVGMQLLSKLQGKEWKFARNVVPHNAVNGQIFTKQQQSVPSAVPNSEQLVPAERTAAACKPAKTVAETESTQELVPRPEQTSKPVDTYYSKFDGGFEGTFADMSDFFGGLENLIGECHKDLMQAMEEEHCAVVQGYGASDVEFRTSSYRVVTTPRNEWHFVVSPDSVPEMGAGMDRETGRDRGYRKKVKVEDLLLNAAELISSSFTELGFNLIVTDEDIRGLPLLLEEIIALRLYTGPMFEIYNTTLRAWGNRPRGIVPSYCLVGSGMDVRNRFTTTLHVLNSGVLKLSRLQPAMTVYRGISRMQLPRAFSEADKYNVRGGVEYGFMSTTTDEQVALTFAKDSDSTSASTLVVANMGLVDRGASLVWLSQYPHEREILLPPLTALEVTDITDFTDHGNFRIRRVTVRLNCNLLSTTIEKLLAVRKKQVQELADIVSKDIVNHDQTPDICQKITQIDRLQAEVKDQESRSFNDNALFSECVGAVMDTLPKLGDQITVLNEHTREVFGLVPLNAAGSFVSSGWDRTAHVWSLDEHIEFRSAERIELPAASISLAASADGVHIASGQFDGSASVRKLGTSVSTLLTCPNRSDIITAVAWADDVAGSPENTVVDVDEVRLSDQSSTAPTLLLAGGTSSGTVLLWDPNEPMHVVGEHQRRDSIGHTATVRSLNWVAVTGQMKLISSSFDRSIVVWRLSSSRTLEFECNLQDKGCASCTTDGRTTAHAGAVTATASAGPWLVSGSEDGAIKLWDLRKCDVPRLCVVHDHSICSLACISPPSEVNTKPWKLAFGSGDNTIVICNVHGRGEVLTTLRGHSGIVNALLWIEARGWLVSASADTTVRVWRVRTDKGLQRPTSERTSTTRRSSTGPMASTEESVVS